MPSPGRARGAVLLLQGLVSFRVVMALVTSASVTASVAGPMAYQAAKAREEVEVAAPAPTTTVATTTTPSPSRPGPVPATSTTTSSTTTSTTTLAPTTTVPGAPPAPQTPTVAPSSTTSTTSTTIPPVTSLGLFSSVSSDHSNPSVLAGSRAFGRVWLFFDGPGVTSVRYWIDGDGSGAPDRVARSPFDVRPEGIEVRTLGLGVHTLRAEVTTVDDTYIRTATFEVVG